MEGETRHNIIWEKVFEKEYQKLIVVEKSTLRDAVIEVVLNKHENNLFTRNRELIDVNSKFRNFIWKNRTFVGKILEKSKAIYERDNAIRAKRIIRKLGNTNKIFVPIPLIVDVNERESVLINLDYGYTLAEDIEKYKEVFSYELMLKIYFSLLDAGIEWGGYVPRNIILYKKRLVFIDWEDVTFRSSNEYVIDSLTAFKIKLGWLQFYRNDSFYKVLTTNYKVDFSKQNLDDFEVFYRNLLDISASTAMIRDLCSEVTIFTEFDENFKEKNITAGEFGALIHDILPLPLSVFYTFTMKRIKNLVEKELYLAIFTALQNILIICLKKYFIEQCNIENIGRQLMMVIISLSQNCNFNIVSQIKNIRCLDELESILIGNSNLSKLYFEIKKLKDKEGYECALIRSKYVDNLLLELYNHTLSIFDFKKKFDFLLRGSQANGVLCKKSDIDFEISSDLYPDGHRTFEELFKYLLQLFEIDSEGSCNRPTETDLYLSNKTTRDLHELMELRQPMCDSREIGWINNKLTNISNQWFLRTSQYEDSLNLLTPKLLFFQIRVFISRYAFKRNINTSVTEKQIEQIKLYYDSSLAKLLHYLISEIVLMYDTCEYRMSKLIEMQYIIFNLCEQYGYPKAKVYYLKGEGQNEIL